MRTAYRLIHPFLQGRIELLGFGGEDQQVALCQPDILGPRRRAERRAEVAAGRSQRYARARQDLGIATPSNQQRGDTGPREHAAQRAADSTGSDDHVPVVVMKGQLPRLPSVLTNPLRADNKLRPCVDSRSWRDASSIDSSRCTR